MQAFTPRCSFNPIIVNGRPSGGQDLLEKECRRMINSKEKVELRKIEPHFLSFPYLLRLILTLYYTLSEKLNYYGSESAYFKSPVTTHLKYSLLKLLANLIEKRLFISTEEPKLYDEMSFSLVFKQCLFSLVLSILSENANFVLIEKLITFYKNLSSEQHLIFLPLHLYHLYGGGQFTIDAAIFKNKLTALIEGLGKVLATSDTIISRNIEQFKASKQRRVLLDESVRVVLISKDKTALPDFVTQVCQTIFQGKLQMQKQDFISRLHQGSYQPVLSIFLLLLREEILLFQDKSFRTTLQLRSDIANTNFYTHELSKLFSKCPYNGDERCSCKKCQCVRRNRESAKLSQERKRSALEQLDGCKLRIQQLEQRGVEQDREMEELEGRVRREAERNVLLEEENLMLRSLLLEMKANPSIKLLMMETLEPVSKVLNSQLD